MSEKPGVVSSGRVFQTQGPATVKTLLPKVESLTGDASRLLDLKIATRCSDSLLSLWRYTLIYLVSIKCTYFKVVNFVHKFLYSVD